MAASRRQGRPPCLSLQGAASGCRFHQLLWGGSCRIWPDHVQQHRNRGRRGFHWAAISHSHLSARLSLSSCPRGGGRPSRMQMSSSARFRLSSRWPSECSSVGWLDLGAMEFLYCCFSLLARIDDFCWLQNSLFSQKWFLWMILLEILMWISYCMSNGWRKPQPSTIYQILIVIKRLRLNNLTLREYGKKPEKLTSSCSFLSAIPKSMSTF